MMLCLLLLLFVGPLYAMPPHPDVEFLIKGGQVKSFSERSSSIDTSLLAGLNTPSVSTSTVATGDFRVLCVLVDFDDNQAQTQPEKYDTLVYDEQSNSVRAYFREVSYNLLDIPPYDYPSDIGWIRAPQDYSYYVDNNYGTYSEYPNNTQKLCEDIVDLIDDQVDFSDYDNDNDGFVDAVVIVHAGTGAEFSGGDESMIWSHKWSITPRSKDGVYIRDYTVVPEYWIHPGDMTIGVFCHELGHVLGLPDLYDTDGSSQGIGIWSLMASGSWNGSLGNSPAHLDAWSKSKLGWVDVIDVDSNDFSLEIPVVEYNPVVYRLWTNGKQDEEYFLVENRGQYGYDQGLPGEGLMIWHIDDLMTHNRYEWTPDSTAYGHYMVALEQADNLYHLENNASYGDAGDPFPGWSQNTSFTPFTEPSSLGYTNTEGFVFITNISSPDSIMTFDCNVSLIAGGETESLPIYSLEQNYPNPFNPQTTIEFTLGIEGMVELKIYNVLGQIVNQPVRERLSPGSYSITWNGTDTDGHTLATGVYFYELACNNESLVRKMIMIK